VGGVHDATATGAHKSRHLRGHQMVKRVRKWHLGVAFELEGRALETVGGRMYGGLSRSLSHSLSRSLSPLPLPLSLFLSLPPTACSITLGLHLSSRVGRLRLERRARSLAIAAAERPSCAQPLSSQLGRYKTVKVRLWP